MRKLVIIIIVLSVAGLVGLHFMRGYWEHRYDELISRQARVYRLDEKLVWSVIYEETYFRSWMIGDADEVGLMQVTPLVARDWAKQTGLKELEDKAANDVVNLLKDPERNIQIGSWYLEKIRERYRGSPAETAMMLAAYNAGPSRVETWVDQVGYDNITEEQFIARIDIPSTKSYVTSILARYRDSTQTTEKIKA